MLETTILKVTHYGTSQAKKLLPYITKAGVYSVEVACLTERLAKVAEQEWEQMLSSGNSRSKFMKEMRERAEEIPTKEERDYELFEKEYLFRNKVPLWFTERFSDKERAKLIEMTDDEGVYRNAALTALFEGDVTGYLGYQWEKLQLMRKSDETSDREIARNINNAEEKLREEYPALSWDKGVHFVVTIGAHHFPEKYTTRLVNIYNISNGMGLADWVYRAVLDGKELEEVKKLMLVVEIQRLVQFGRIPLKEKQIMAMDFEQLVGEINKISKRL